MDTIIRETLRPFGITRNYRGYPQTVRAIALVLEDESRLLNVQVKGKYDLDMLLPGLSVDAYYGFENFNMQYLSGTSGLSFSARGIQTDRFWSKWRDLR